MRPFFSRAPVPKLARAPALALAFALTLVAGCAAPAPPPGPERFALEARGVPSPIEGVKAADAQDASSAWVAYRFANDTSVPTLTQTWAREVGKVGWTDIKSTVEGNVGSILASKKGLALRVWVAHSDQTTCCVEGAASAPVMTILVVKAA